MSESKKSFLQSKMLALLIVAAAAYVNRDFLKGLFEEVASDVGELVMPGVEEPPAAPGGAPMAATFMPVAVRSVLADPFAHDLETRIATAKRVATPTSTKTVADLELPTVRLVLLGSASKRALIVEPGSGPVSSRTRIVTAGDAISIGRVDAVLESGVRIRTKNNTTLVAPLAERTAPVTQSNNPVDRAAGANADTNSDGGSPR